MAPTIGQLWRSGRDRLAGAVKEGAALDARLLAEAALGLSATRLIADEREAVGQEDAARFDALIARRISGEPVARIVGRKEFYGLSFGLNAATLVPRPETEMLVDFALSLLAADRPAIIVDLGTGTGCIPLAILAHRPRAVAVASDIAPLAVAQARANAGALGLADRFEAVTGSWFDAPVPARADLIVSNPPYIESEAISGLAPEVADHDPHAALDGGSDGLAPYRAIATGLAAHLAPGGAVALEIGTGQGAAVAALLVAGGLDAVAIHNDLTGHQRMVTARAPTRQSGIVCDPPD